VTKILDLISVTQKGFLRKKAQYWDDEVKDMSDWTNNLLESIFGSKHKIQSLISDGYSDYFIDDIPVEDKLLRTNENLKNENIMTLKYNKEK